MPLNVIVSGLQCLTHLYTCMSRSLLCLDAAIDVIVSGLQCLTHLYTCMPRSLLCLDAARCYRVWFTVFNAFIYMYAEVTIVFRCR